MSEVKKVRKSKKRSRKEKPKKDRKKGKKKSGNKKTKVEDIPQTEEMTQLPGSEEEEEIELKSDPMEVEEEQQPEEEVEVEVEEEEGEGEEQVVEEVEVPMELEEEEEEPEREEVSDDDDEDLETNPVFQFIEAVNLQDYVHEDVDEEKAIAMEGKDMVGEAAQTRDGSMPSIRCVLIGFGTEKGQIVESQYRQDYKSRNGKKMKLTIAYVLVIGFNDFEESAKCRWVKKKKPQEIQYRGNHGQEADSRELKRRAGIDHFDDRLEWVNVKVGDYMKIKFYSATFKTGARTGDIVSADDVSIGLFDYVPKQKKKKVNPDIQAGNPTDPLAFKTVKDIVTATTAMGRNIRKEEEVVDLVKFLRYRIPIATKLGISDQAYQVILPVGAQLGMDPDRRCMWSMNQTVHTNPVRDFKWDKKSGEVDDAIFKEEDADRLKKQLTERGTFTRYEIPPKADAKSLTKAKYEQINNGTATHVSLDMHMWGRQVEKMFLVTRQSVWFDIISAVHPVLEFFVVGKFKSKDTKNIGYNIGDKSGDVSHIAKFDCTATLFSLGPWLKKNAFKVSSKWVEEQLRTPELEEGQKVQSVETKDPDRPIVHLYPEGIDHKVINLSNYSGTVYSFLKEKNYEYRVLTDTWFPKEANQNQLTYDGLRAQGIALRRTARLPIEESEKALSGDENSEFRVTSESTLVIYAIKKQSDRV